MVRWTSIVLDTNSNVINTFNTIFNIYESTIRGENSRTLTRTMMEIHFYVAGISFLLKSCLVLSQFDPNLYNQNNLDLQYPRYQIIDNIKVYSQPQYVDRDRFLSRDPNFNPQDPSNYDGKFIRNVSS